MTEEQRVADHASAVDAWSRAATNYVNKFSHEENEWTRNHGLTKSHKQKPSEFVIKKYNGAKKAVLAHRAIMNNELRQYAKVEPSKIKPNVLSKKRALSNRPKRYWQPS